MHQIINDIKSTLSSNNYYSSIISCLCLIDICASIEFEKENSSKDRFVNWFNKYLLDKYEHKIGCPSKLHTFLSGADCYALRCSIVHNGSDVTQLQKSKDKLGKFVFQHNNNHLCQNKYINGDDYLILDVKVFCGDVLGAASNWLTDIKGDKNKQQKVENIFKVLKF
jgi:hypothetical protein